MRIVDILEDRKNPVQNPRGSLQEFFAKYRGKKNYYCHWSAIPKVGINPKTENSQDSPHGVYATNMFDLGDGHPPYGDTSRGYWFILKSDVPYDQEYSIDEYKLDVEKLKNIYGASAVESAISRKHPHTSLDNPLINIYNIARVISGNGNGRRIDIKAWASILRELGFTYIIDHREGFIHPAEDHQIVFLGDLEESKLQYTTIDMFGFYAPRKVTIVSHDGSENGRGKEFSETHAKRLKFDNARTFRSSLFFYDSRFLKTLILNFEVDSNILTGLLNSMDRANSKFKVSIKSVRLRNIEWYTHFHNSPAFKNNDNVSIQSLQFNEISDEHFGLLRQLKFPKNIGEIIFYNAGMLDVPEGVDHRVEFDEGTGNAPSKPSFGDLVDGRA
jgi:hypothetical protein